MMRSAFGTDALRVDEPSFAAQVFQTGRPFLLPSVTPERLRAATKPEAWSLLDRLGVQSLLGVPLRVSGQPIGVLILLRHQSEQPPFDEADLTLAQDLADRAALAIANARLFQQVQVELAERQRVEQALQRSAERLKVLADASQAFAEVGMEYHAVLDRVARRIAGLLSDGCAIRLISEDRVWLLHAALYDRDAEKLAFQRRIAHDVPLRVAEPTLTTRTFQSSQALLIPVFASDAIRATAQPEYTSLVYHVGIHSLIIVPMRVHGQAIGVMS
jgi:GAF domain-containing protein